jgi:hypothetical protein
MDSRVLLDALECRDGCQVLLCALRKPRFWREIWQQRKTLVGNWRVIAALLESAHLASNPLAA